ncbi:MAG: Hsp20/alpha crystallin family protein [Verrucomicrobia bacterium]|nr:MAG: Hsp20/alpha crystallin family protein [Verrucomicrobiota bacterium]
MNPFRKKGTLNMKTEIKKNPETIRRHRTRRPRYEVKPCTQGYDVLVDMPGVNRSGANVTLEKGTLTIEGNVTESVPEDWRSLRRELSTSDYALKLQLNVDVAGDAITASTEDGVLTVRLPIAEEAKPRSITID